MARIQDCEASPFVQVLDGFHAMLEPITWGLFLCQDSQSDTHCFRKYIEMMGESLNFQVSSSSQIMYLIVSVVPTVAVLKGMRGSKSVPLLPK